MVTRRLILLLALAAMACNATQAPSWTATPSPTARPTMAAIDDRALTAIRTTAPAAIPTQAPPACIVTTGQPGGLLFLRAEPRRNSRALTTLTEGQRLQPMATAGAWVNVQAGELAGWINTQYCKEVTR